MSIPHWMISATIRFSCSHRFTLYINEPIKVSFSLRLGPTTATALLAGMLIGAVLRAAIVSYEQTLIARFCEDREHISGPLARSRLPQRQLNCSAPRI